MLQVRSAFHLNGLYNDMKASTATSGQKTNEIFSMQIARTSKFHIIYIMFEMTRDSIKSFNFRDLNVKNILEVLLKVFALKQI